MSGGEGTTTGGVGSELDERIRAHVRDRLVARDVPRWLAVAAAWTCRPDPSVEAPVRAAVGPDAASVMVEEWLAADGALAADLLELFVPEDRHRLARLVGVESSAPIVPPPLPPPPPPVPASVVPPPPPPPAPAGRGTGRFRIRRVLAGIGVVFAGLVVVSRVVNVIGGVASVVGDLAVEQGTVDRSDVAADSTHPQVDMGCYRWTEVGGVEAARCSEAHDFEGLAWLPPGAVRSWDVQDQAEMDDRAGEGCAQAFEDQFGTAIGRTPLSLWWYTPEAADESTYEWGVSCLVWSSVPLVGSVRGDIGGALGEAVAVTDLEVGSCVEGELDGLSLAAVPTSCGTEGAAQILVVEDLPAGPYPGDDALYIQAEDACFDALEAAGFGADAAFDFGWPSVWDWEVVDRRLTLCLVWPDVSVGPAALAPLT